MNNVCKVCGHRHGEPTGDTAYGQSIIYVVPRRLCQFCYFEQYNIFLHKRAGIEPGSGNYGERLVGYDGTLFEGSE